jgi:hypothetical protein
MGMKNMHVIYKVMTPMKTFGMKARLNWLVLMLLLPLPFLSAAGEQQTFTTPEAAVDALTAALKANDYKALVSIVGEKYKNLVITGDQAYDSATHAETVAKISEFHTFDERENGHRVLLIGSEAWPIPIPLVLEANVWRFASEQGATELLNRRIGRNENSAIELQRAYLDAQRQYALQDHDGDGVLQYAQKLISAPGKHDGLYWPADADKDEKASPFGPLVAESSAYLNSHMKSDPYRGYRFKILTGQGKSAPGGAYNYIINRRMIAGFAMVAYPVNYGDSGVMSFIVSHNGKVYEKDLGANTNKLGAKMTIFNPSAGWKEVTP